MLSIIITNSEAMCASPAEGNALHFDPTRLTPEQIEQFKTLLGIGSSNEQQPGTPVAFDPGTLTSKQVEALKQTLGINASQGTGQVLDFASLSPEQVEALKQALETSEFYTPSLTRKIFSEQINMGYVSLVS